MTDPRDASAVPATDVLPIHASFAPSRVWVVEDSPGQLQHLVSLLSQEFEVEAFVDAESVLERIGVHAGPDLLIVDWHLPGISGLELCGFLREKFSPAALPILVLTVRTAPEDSASAFKVGANDYVHKPFSSLELLARVRTLVQARKSQQLAQGVLEAMADGFVAVDGTQRITMANRHLVSLISAEPGELIGRALGELAPEIASQLKHDAKPGEVRRFETRRQGRWLEVDVYATADKGRSLFLRDVTARKEQEFKDVGRAELERQLIGIVSHDLRNPVSTILMSAQSVLRLKDLDPRAKTPTERIFTAAQRTERMIRDLLDFTQARVGVGLLVSKGPADLHATVTQVVEELRVSRPGRMIQLESEGDVRGVWDTDRLAQLTGNLIANALDYGAQEEPVTVRTQGGASDVTLSVRNHGSVILPAQLDRIFEPMQRSTNQASPAGRSVGLGLYIVRKVAEAHGGHVSVESSQAGGTTFHVTLPRAPN